MTMGTESSDSSATSPAVNPSRFTAFDQDYVSSLIRERKWDELSLYLDQFISFNPHDGLVHEHPGLMFIVFEQKFLDLIRNQKFDEAMLFFKIEVAPLPSRHDNMFTPLDLLYHVGRLETYIEKRMLPDNNPSYTTDVTTALFDYILLYFPSSIRSKYLLEGPKRMDPETSKYLFGGRKRKDPETSNLQNAKSHAASPSLPKQFSQEPHGGSYAKKRQLSVEGVESHILSVMKELAQNNLGILESFPPSDSSSLAFAVRDVCQMQRLVINKMEDTYYKGEHMDTECIMGCARTMQENSFKLIPLVVDFPVLYLKAKDLDLSIAKLRWLCFFDMSYISQSGSALGMSS